jgi:hypothetical protein
MVCCSQAPVHTAGPSVQRTRGTCAVLRGSHAPSCAVSSRRLSCSCAQPPHLRSILPASGHGAALPSIAGVRSDGVGFRRCVPVTVFLSPSHRAQANALVADGFVQNRTSGMIQNCDSTESSPSAGMGCPDWGTGTPSPRMGDAPLHSLALNPPLFSCCHFVIRKDVGL